MKSRDEVKEAYALQAKNMLKIPRTPLEGVKTILEGLEKIPAAETVRGYELDRRAGKRRLCSELIQALERKHSSSQNGCVIEQGKKLSALPVA